MVTIRRAVGHEPRQALDPAARGDDHVGRLEDPLAAGARRAVLAGLADADRFGPSSRPRPATQVTLFLSTRLLRPVHIRLTTASRRVGDRGVVDARARPAGRSRSPSAARARSTCSADSRSALVGMQPRWRHVPPILSSSTSATRRPELGGPEGGRVAAGAGAEDDEVEVVAGADGHRVGQPRELRDGDRLDGTRAVPTHATEVRPGIRTAAGRLSRLRAGALG